MRKADRLFQLVNLIRAHQPICAERLAERMQVSVRSIYRYIDDISLSGIPVYGTPGVGYALHDTFELPPLSLTSLEFEALMLAVDMLASTADQALGAAARSLLGKVAASLPGAAPAPDQAPLRALGRTPPVMRDHFGTLRRAIEQGRSVRITYLSLTGQLSHRLVYPLGLFYWGGKWTLGSWCTTRGAYRDFRVDRIAAATLDALFVADRHELTLQAYTRHQAEQWKSLIGTDSMLSG
ncbi:helix-turn-helix transcriptional regulator [Pseudomonas cremoricolorata]|uniref:helix-turn-helix transcriptional regulator n=1 Tax=Pseudomonas cremoricolorata TaxID=157783 RepID=UPI00041F79DE|nr:YafY family protein [Pseudomonas cremoricolorata]